ncbi:MAG: DUF1059 domain-containing protein [Bacteroidota bacterium]
MKHLAVITIVVFLALALTVPSSTQDVGKTSSSQATAETQQEAESMTLKTFSCAGECGFSVTSRSEDEIVGIVIGHAKTFHKKQMTPDDVKARLTVHQQEGKKKREK